MSQQHGHFAGEQGRHRVERIVSSGGGDPEIEFGELGGEGFGGCQVGLGQAQDGFESAGVRGDQGALHQAGAWRRIGESDDDQQLIGVGDDDAFGGVGVIGGAPQHGSPLTSPHDASQRVVLARDIADDADVVTHDDRGASEFACAHRGDDAVGVGVERAAPPAAVDGDHHGFVGVCVIRSGLCSRPRSSAGTDPDIGLVVLARAQSPASMSAHIRGKSGSVLAVVPMSSTSTPSTRNPTMAPAVAIR